MRSFSDKQKKVYCSQAITGRSVTIMPSWRTRRKKLKQKREMRCREREREREFRDNLVNMDIKSTQIFIVKTPSIILKVDGEGGRNRYYIKYQK